MDDARFGREEQRYWDAIARGEHAPSGDLAPELAAIIRHLHASGDAPFPHPSYTTRLREELMHTTTHPMTRSPQLSSNGRTSPYDLHTLAPPVARQPRWSQPLTPLATAALVAITLVIAVVILRAPGGSLPDDAPVGLPALFVPATPGSPEATATGAPETVLATTLPADQVPTAGNLDAVLWHAVLDPGQATAFTAEEVDCCAGVQITQVIAGDLTLRVDGPMQLLHGNSLATGVPDDVAAGSGVLLRSGDTAIYDFSLPAEYANQGTVPLHLIGGGVVAGSRVWPPAGMTLLDGNEAYAVPALPPGPVTLTLVRATLPPRGTLPAPSPNPLILEVGAEGDASIGQGADGSLRNIGPKEQTIYALTISPAGTAASTPAP